MKIKVITPFIDKYDNSIRYEPGTVIDIDDKERAADLIARGLGKKVRTSSKPAKKA